MALRGRLVTGPSLRGQLSASQGGIVIPDGSVTEEKIASGAVTNSKIASGAVTADKMDVTLTYTITDGNLTIGIE